jgi:mannonate dehydratase
MIPATQLDALPLRVGLGQLRETADADLRFIKHCGVDDYILNAPLIPGDTRWELEDLVPLREKAEAHQLRLMAIENVPIEFYDQIMLGLPGRDAQLENMCATVRNIGAAGIPIFGYHFMPAGVYRTEWMKPLPSGAKTTAFKYAGVRDLPLHADRVYTEEELWANYDWYLERILPVAEEANVRLALHPDDPPVEAIAGMPRLFRNFENFRRAMDHFDSPHHGLNFCHGCWSEMRGGAGILDAIEHFGSRNKIFYVHLRDVTGTAEDFTECWLGEGNSNIPDVIRALRAVNFNSFMIPDHVPLVEDDTQWCHRGRAWTIGYMKAMLEVIP